jgi:hypothetical protein
MAVAITEPSSTRISPLEPIWHRIAPRRVVEACGENDLPRGWTAWQKHLARRKNPAQPPFLDGGKPALLWGLPADFIDTDFSRLVASFEANGLPNNSDLQQALQLLAAAYLLPKLSGQISAQSWWQLIEQFYELASEADQYRVDWPADPVDVLRQQLLAGELPLALSYLFPEIRALRSLRAAARNVFSEALVELTDGEGLPHARLLPVFGPLFGCWTRARWLGENLARGAWSDKAEVQYQWLVRRAIRLADAEKRFVLRPRDSRSTWSKTLFRTALELAGDEADCAAAATALGNGVLPTSAKFDRNDLPKPSLDSDWSAISVLAGGWSRSTPRLAVSYAGNKVQIELSARGEQIFIGAWNTQTQCDGKPAQIAGEWENLCWQSDSDCDFLELSIPLSEGLRIERQLLLARNDEVLYLADIVVSASGQARRLKHSLSLPLDDDAVWQPEAQTRDGVLRAGKLQAAVLPLALPEWRVDPRGGTLTEENGQLVLTQEATGRAMCCPLFFDLKPTRVKKERTWRQLTVAEWMEVLPRDVAVGFRAQSGRAQWLIYRSLGPSGNRTVLGHNIAGEFCAGRFRSGKFEEWLEIEAV